MNTTDIALRVPLNIVRLNAEAQWGLEHGHEAGWWTSDSSLHAI